MNTVHHEIAEEAGMGQYVAVHNKYLEWYTEAIIRECCRVMHCRQTELDLENVSLDNPARDFSNEIIKHFGIGP